MKHTKKAVVIKARFNWADAGSWLSLWEMKNKDARKNFVNGPVLLDSVSDCYIDSTLQRTAVVGLKNVVIINSEEGLLIADKENHQGIKRITDKMKQQKPSEISAGDINMPVLRPWGSYESVHNGEQHQVKHIVVAPGEKLSLQYHHHRSEHWIVVKGLAEVIVDDDCKLLGANESVYIPKQAVHRLTNVGKEELHLIEVQCGHYLGEDDIVRLEDKYGRIMPESENSLSSAA